MPAAILRDTGLVAGNTFGAAFRTNTTHLGIALLAARPKQRSQVP
ncbi:MAG: hypothetical protein ACJ72N_25350 [Labedaea sp.]